MSATVLYYPNVSLVAPRPANSSQDYEKTDTNLLKTALLLWDSIEVIVPYADFGVRPFISEQQQDEQREIEQAFEHVVRERSVTDLEKEEVHKSVEKMIKTGLPAWLEFQVRVDNFDMYPEKLLNKTWQLLCDAKVAKPGRKGGTEYFGLQRSLGLVLMNIIADVCAGKTREKVTNYIDAHDACGRVFAAQNGGEVEIKPSSAAHKRLVSVSLLGANVNAVSLANLLRLREREKEDGFLPMLRENYRKFVNEYVTQLKNVTKPQDIANVEDAFKTATANDFRHLNKELRLRAAGVVIGSVAAGFLSFAGFGADPTLGSALGMTASLPVFSLARQSSLEKHKTAWLYQAASPIQPY